MKKLSFLILSVLAILTIVLILTSCERKSGRMDTRQTEVDKEKIETTDPSFFKKWTKEDGIIYLSVTSSGMSGEEWSNKLGKKVLLTENSISMLKSQMFTQTSNTTYKLVILDEESMHKLTSLNREKIKRVKSPEVACLIGDYLSHDELKEMGFWGLIIMHTEIEDHLQDPCLFGILRTQNRLTLFGHRSLMPVNEHGFGYVFQIE